MSGWWCNDEETAVQTQIEGGSATGAGPSDSSGASSEFGAYAELYDNHVAIARCIRGWSERMVPDLVSRGRPPGSEPVCEDDYLLGYLRALQDMADLLVDGDGLPDGPLFQSRS